MQSLISTLLVVSLGSLVVLLVFVTILLVRAMLNRMVVLSKRSVDAAELATAENCKPSP